MTTKVKTGVIGDQAVTAAQIANDTITATQISANAIGSSELADGAVDTNAVQDGSVTAAKLAATLDLSSKTLTMPTGLGGWVYGAQVATTSGTAIDLLLAIPDTAREIEIMLTGVSTNTAAQPPLLQLGDAGGYETSGYIGEVTIIQDASPNESAVTDGFSLARATNFVAADLVTGILRLSRWDTAEHQWIASGQFITEGTIHHSVCGYKTTSQAMDRIRLTTTGGTATFDAGEARVRYR